MLEVGGRARFTRGVGFLRLWLLVWGFLFCWFSKFYGLVGDLFFIFVWFWF